MIDHKRLNDCVRGDLLNPEDWEDTQWKIFAYEEGFYWLIPEGDDVPADDNIIDGPASCDYVAWEDAFQMWTGMEIPAYWETPSMEVVEKFHELGIPTPDSWEAEDD